MILLTGEVAFPLHGAIVLAFGLVQNDPHPFPGCEERGSDVGHSPPLAFSDDLHHRANLGMTRGCESSYGGFIRILLLCVSKETYFWSFSTLHCSCTAHLADQWAGQLGKKHDRDI